MRSNRKGYKKKRFEFIWYAFDFSWNYLVLIEQFSSYMVVVDFIRGIHTYIHIFIHISHLEIQIYVHHRYDHIVGNPLNNLSCFFPSI